MSAIAATTEDIQIFEKPGNLRVLPVLADEVIPAGALVATDTDGYAVNAADTAGLTVVGVAIKAVDNTDGDDGDLNVTVKVGVFGFQNSADNAVDPNNVGKTCYIESNCAVAETSTNKVVAGYVYDIGADDSLVYVAVGTPAGAPVATQVTLGSTNGTAAAAADLAALKAEAEKIGDDVRAIHAALVNAGIVRA